MPCSRRTRADADRTAPPAQHHCRSRHDDALDDVLAGPRRAHSLHGALTSHDPSAHIANSGSLLTHPRRTSSHGSCSPDTDRGPTPSPSASDRRDRLTGGPVADPAIRDDRHREGHHETERPREPLGLGGHPVGRSAPSQRTGDAANGAWRMPAVTRIRNSTKKKLATTWSGMYCLAKYAYENATAPTTIVTPAAARTSCLLTVIARACGVRPDNRSVLDAMFHVFPLRGRCVRVRAGRRSGSHDARIERGSVSTLPSTFSGAVGNRGRRPCATLFQGDCGAHLLAGAIVWVPITAASRLTRCR
jgi:hypothetical protein